MALGIIAIAAGAGSALSQGAQSEPQSERLQAYLSATQLELAGTGHDVDSIGEAADVAGLQIFELEGAAAVRCLLIAAATQPNGHSQQLACTRDATSESDPLATAVASPTDPGGRIDIVALPDTATDVAVTSDDERRPATLTVSRDVAIVAREGRLGPATLMWRTADRQHRLSLGADLIPAIDARR